jgi:hypothetical protein
VVQGQRTAERRVVGDRKLASTFAGNHRDNAAERCGEQLVQQGNQAISGSSQGWSDASDHNGCGLCLCEFWGNGWV